MPQMTVYVDNYMAPVDNQPGVFQWCANCKAQGAGATRG